MDIIFMNSINSGTSDPHRLLLNLTDEITLKRSEIVKKNHTNCKKITQK